MSLTYCLIFLILFLACILSAIVAWDSVGWFGVAFLYAALSFILLSVAYAGVGPALLLKRKSGRRSIWAWLLFGPYFVLNWLAYGLYHLISREPAFAQVTPSLFFGRRLSTSECVEHNWISVLDLAAEFAEVRPLRTMPGYRSLPVLDATAPSDAELRSVVDWLAAAVTAGPVYIHCAVGHGRSACVVIAYLLAVGEVKTVAEGVKRLRLVRPSVGLRPGQRRRLQGLVKSANE